MSRTVQPVGLVGVIYEIFWADGWTIISMEASNSGINCICIVCVIKFIIVCGSNDDNMILYVLCSKLF